MLIAYDAAGNVIATQDYRTIHDDEGNAVGLVDYAGHEEAGGEMLDVWTVEQHDGKDPATRITTRAKGSKVWPEWIGGAAAHFRVELEGPAGAKRIARLVHKVSGHRRERSAVEGEIMTRIEAKRSEAHERGEDTRGAIRSARQAERQALRQELRSVREPVALVELYLPDVPEPGDPEPEPVDIRDLVGGPDRPLELDMEGRTKAWVAPKRLNVPIVGVAPA